MNSYAYLESPIGRLLLTADEAALTAIYLDPARAPSPEERGWTADANTAPLLQAVRQLEEYFEGGRREFELPMRPAGTDFQRRVWSALAEIRYGETWSYGRLATRIGNPNASRAVGLANGRNPIPIILPCHRVIGADGSLTGYGGGLERKSWLLEHEGVCSGRPARSLFARSEDGAQAASGLRSSARSP